MNSSDEETVLESCYFIMWLKENNPDYYPIYLKRLCLDKPFNKYEIQLVKEWKKQRKI